VEYHIYILGGHSLESAGVAILKPYAPSPRPVKRLFCFISHHYTYVDVDRETCADMRHQGGELSSSRIGGMKESGTIGLGCRDEAPRGEFVHQPIQGLGRLWRLFLDALTDVQV
jgi:hypothetical protein